MRSANAIGKGSQNITSAEAADRTGVTLQRRLFILILLVVSFAVYLNTTNNGYVLDDIAVVKENTIVAKGFTAIPEIFSTPYLKGFRKDNDTAAVNDLYRPLPLAMFAAERQLFGDKPASSHWVNIILFAGCVLLLFLFLDQLFDRRRTLGAFIAALLFAVHPIHTEVVANIKSRDELLCFFFGIMALLAFARYTAGGKIGLLFAGALTYFLSLLSKETSVSFLLLLPLIVFFYVGTNRRRAIIVCLSAVAVVMAFLAIRYAVLKGNNAASTHMDIIENELVAAPTWLSAKATAMSVLGKYLLLLFIPYPLSCDYAYNSIPLVSFNATVLLSLLAYLVLGIIAVRRLMHDRKDAMAFGLAFFLITLAIFSNLFILIGATMAERFLFFPSVGFCLAAAVLLEKVLSGENSEPAWNNKFWYVTGIVSLVFAAITINRNMDWKDNYTLFKTDVRKYPGNARLWHSLGYELTNVVINEESDTAAKAQIMREGLSDIQKAISIYPDYTKAHNDLGNLFVQFGLYDSAEAHLLKAIQLAPRNPVAISDLGRVYFIRQNYAKAVGQSKMALAINPQNATVWNNMAICYLQLKQYDSALYAAQRSLALAPHNNQLAQDNIAAAQNGIRTIDTVRGR